VSLVLSAGVRSLSHSIARLTASQPWALWKFGTPETFWPVFHAIARSVSCWLGAPCIAVPTDCAQQTLSPLVTSELGQRWEYEAGGKHDMLQPVTGWWLVKIKDGQYGKDEDCPDVQFDSDAEDYDDDLARNARPLGAKDHSYLVPAIS
jgi:hypothetical protein